MEEGGAPLVNLNSRGYIMSREDVFFIYGIKLH